MGRKTFSYGDSTAIAVRCIANADLGNICKRFYEVLYSPDTCSYAASLAGLRMELGLRADGEPGSYAPCEIRAVKGGRPLPRPERSRDSADQGHQGRGDSLGGSRSGTPCCYDFALIGECGEVDVCLDAFLRRAGLREIENRPSYLSSSELASAMRRRERIG